MAFSDRDLVFRTILVEESGLLTINRNLVTGPCLLNGVFQLGGFNNTWRFIDGVTLGGQTIMSGDGIGQVQPMAFPEINVMLTSGLFVSLQAGNSAWAFVVGRPE